MVAYPIIKPNKGKDNFINLIIDSPTKFILFQNKGLLTYFLQTLLIN